MVVIEDHTKEYMTDEGEQKEDVTIMMKKDAEDEEDDEVVDMQDYDNLEQYYYVRKVLKLRKKMKIKLVCLVPYGEGRMMCARPASPRPIAAPRSCALVSQFSDMCGPLSGDL